MALPLSSVSLPTEGEMETRVKDDPLREESTQTRIETAADSEVDIHLQSLVRTTSLRELARTRNATTLKTISERELKDWIKEALHRVISTTTSLGEAERQQLLASARHEFSEIMRAHEVESSLQAENASALAVLLAEQEGKDQLLAASEARGLGRITDLQDQLMATIARCESFAQRVGDLEHILAESLADPNVDTQEFTELREQLDQRTAQVAETGASRDQAQRETRAVTSRLLREQDRARDEKAVLLDRIVAGDRANTDLDRRRDDAGRRADDAEAQLAAASTEELAVAHRTRIARESTEVLRADHAASIEAAECTRERLTEELATARLETAATQEHLVSALQAGGVMRTATDRQALEAREILAATGLERQHSADTLLASETDRKIAEQALGESGEAFHLIVRERDRLVEALQIADQGLQAVEDRVRDITSERDDAQRHAKAAFSRARKQAGRSVTTPQIASPNDIIALQAALTRARSVVTSIAGQPREDVGGPLAARKAGHWLCIWSDAKGRMKTARMVGQRWLGAGRTEGVAPVVEVEGEPVIISRGDGVQAGWRDIHGHAQVARLDPAGHLKGPARDLGWSYTTPNFSRGGGDAPTFIVTADTQGHVLLHESDGSAPIDLTAALKAPPAAGSPAGWHWPLEGSRHITYRDAEGSVHAYQELKGSWQHVHLSALAKAPVAASDPVGYAPADHGHVLYVGLDGHIHELCYDLAQWQHHDLTAIADAPASAGRPSAAYVAGCHCVVFRGLDGAAHMLRQRRDWRHLPLVELGAVADDPKLGSNGGEGALSFRGSDGARRVAHFSTTVSDLKASCLPG